MRQPCGSGGFRLPRAAGTRYDSVIGKDAMAHTRLRKFNTKDSYPEQALDNDLCQVVHAGNTVFLRG